MQITASRGLLAIQGTLDIAVAVELRNALSDSLGGNSSLIVDLSGVDACDTAALQLLYSARKTAERSAKYLRFRGISDAIATAGAALGLSIEEVAEDRGPGAAGEGPAGAI